jgi:hypothetical protein
MHRLDAKSVNYIYKVKKTFNQFFPESYYISTIFNRGPAALKVFYPKIVKTYPKIVKK